MYFSGALTAQDEISMLKTASKQPKDTYTTGRH